MSKSILNNESSHATIWPMIVDKNTSLFFTCITCMIVAVLSVLNSTLFTPSISTLSINSITLNSSKVDHTSLINTPTIFEYIVITETPIPTRTPTPTRTSTPTPTKTPIKINSSEISEIITKYSNHYSVSRELLAKIGQCESGFNPNAKNGIYGGMYQFSEGSWRSIRRLMNMDDNPDLRYNAEESIKTAAFKLSIHGPGAWPNCSK